MALIGFIGCDESSDTGTTGSSGGSTTSASSGSTSGGSTTGTTTGGSTGGSTGSGTTGGTGGTGAVVDSRDGQSYDTVVIGSQTWLARNMNYEAPTGSFCFGNTPANCTTFGRLYTYATATQACPAGTHLASDDEWKTLETTLGMAANQLDLEGETFVRGTTEGTALKVGGSSGFDAKLGGYASGTSFYALNTDGFFWTSSTASAGEIWRRHVDSSTPYLYRFQNPPSAFAISVRCLK